MNRVNKFDFKKIKNKNPLTAERIEFLGDLLMLQCVFWIF